MGRLSNDDGHGNENDKEATSLDEQNNNFIRASRFLYILGRRCTTATGNFLILRARFMELVNTAQNFLFSFSTRYGPFGFNPRPEYRKHLTN